MIGSVYERSTHNPPPTRPARFNGAPGTGFPTAQHRSKSALKCASGDGQAKGGVKNGKRMASDVSPLQSQTPTGPFLPSAAPTMVCAEPIPTDTDVLRRQIHEENAQRIARMTEKEVEEEKRAILDQLGEGTGELLRRVQEARRRKEEREREARGALEVRTTQASNEHAAGRAQAAIASPMPHRTSHGLAAKPSVLRVKSLENMGQTVASPLPATSSTRPSSRASRRLRFAEVTPDDVHVYESAPRSPKQTVLALPPPPDTKDDSIVSLGTFKQSTIPFKRSHTTNGLMKEQPTCATEDDDEPEEGTPEYIRRRYFSGMPANDPSLAWMEASSSEAIDLSVPRFDLHGVPIPASFSVSLSSHLGLHHHAEGSHAGYTIDDIFLLSRSTMPAQRTLMLGILAKITHRLSRQIRDPGSAERIAAFVGQEGQLREPILAAGLAAIDQIGSLGARAADVVWECLVEWDRTTCDVEGVELALAPNILSLLQLDYFLPQVTEVFSHSALPSESLVHLLAVIHWLAQQSNTVAASITNTPRLIPTILDTFLLTPIPPMEDRLLPNPLALQLLITLASSSRSNASALLGPADALLRFVTLLPPSSPYPPALNSTLLMHTLTFYTTLASYGLYSHIATTASQVFTALASYILSASPSSMGITNTSTSDCAQLRIAWASLVEAWTVCATDPHATTPPHEILWSQVCAWGWATDVRKLREGVGSDRSDWALYAAIWDTEAAWLEGARVNSIKGGQAEREEALLTLRSSFSAGSGAEFGIVQHALEAAQRDLAEEAPTTIQDGKRVLVSLASVGNVLSSALRLFLACLPPHNDSAPLSAPPFALPLSELSALSAALVKHPIWSLPSMLGAEYLQVYLRSLTRFVVQFHRVSRYIPGTSPQLWFAQALVFLPRLLPGDESHAFAMLDAFSLVTPQFVGIESTELPKDVQVNVLRPFYEYAVRPKAEVYVAPLGSSTESIARSSTGRIPAPYHSGPGDDNDDPARTLCAGLPLTRDVLFAPLTHLLRSGMSPVFRSPPDNWTASEVDAVCATLLLAVAARRALVVHGLEPFVSSAAEVVFACMRVCMLEHGVGASGSEGEVFRDAGVERLMARLLAPLTVRTHLRRGEESYPEWGTARTLEDASRPYLGSTPFYRFYTDLVALYGAVSFGHRIFAALVVTPLAMGYAADYRRALWCGGEGGGEGGLGDVARSVRLPIEDVVCTSPIGLREYLYPIERDAAVLGAHVAALVAQDGRGPDGFLRFVAVHHVACTVWVDLADEDGGAGRADAEGREEVRARLLGAVLVHGGRDAVRDVVRYRQRARGVLTLPPACYRDGGDGGRQEVRLAFVRRSVGDSAVDRVRGLLPPT